MPAQPYRRSLVPVLLALVIGACTAPPEAQNPLAGEGRVQRRQQRQAENHCDSSRQRAKESELLVRIYQRHQPEHRKAPGGAV